MSVILIDDGDIGFSAPSPPWSIATDPSFGNNDCRQASSGATIPAVYDFGNPGSGSAVFELRWGAHANRATNVGWQIKAGSTVIASGTINQQEWPASGGIGTFRTIGTVNTTGVMSVEVMPGTNGYTVVDQCRMTFTPSVTPPPPPPPSSGISLQAVLDKIEADYQAALGAAAEQRQFSIQWANEAVGS